ncbi:MAG: glycosyltransferase family 2 protein, partial [Candidatus Omnitrophota bacterium]
MRVICVIPSFNEEQTIGWIVAKLTSAGYGVVVVDDGSSDQTAKLARQSGAEVMVNRHNLGKGASLRRAFAILKEREDYDVVVMMDADGQHLPSDIPLFLKHYRH